MDASTPESIVASLSVLTITTILEPLSSSLRSIPVAGTLMMDIRLIKAARLGNAAKLPSY